MTILNVKNLKRKKKKRRKPMFAYELPINPPVSLWEECHKPEFIQHKIREICESIAKKGAESPYQDIVDILYEHIEDNIEKFLVEADYGDYE
jgi:hypothetical protein